MSATQQEKPKKSFEFRMSKKVAELTQVVHMLFTRNHEKEVEIDALKKAYEKEIELVLVDAQGRISRLERSVEEAKKKSASDVEKVRKGHQEELAVKESELRQRVSDVERQLHEERTECRNLRDLLIHAQSDIEKLRQGVTDEISSKSDELRRKDKEAEKLRLQLLSTEAELKNSKKDAQGLIVELETTNASLEEELRQLGTLMENSHKTRDQLLTRNKSLEHDMKTLKREFNKKATEIANSQLKNVRNNLSLEANEELERLRREVQRYRLELSNRDNNFNRMFTDKQPVLLLNQRQTAMTKSNPNALYTSYSGGGQQSLSAGQTTFRNGSGNANTISSQNGLGSGLLLERQSTKNGLTTNSNSNSARMLERQMTLPERKASSDRVFHSANSNGKVDERPRTQGPAFANERLVAGERHYTAMKQQLSPIVQDDPSQILPQRQERPGSSSLPSICSTPERRSSLKQLAKPKPLPREMLYGK